MVSAWNRLRIGYRDRFQKRKPNLSAHRAGLTTAGLGHTNSTVLESISAHEKLPTRIRSVSRAATVLRQVARHPEGIGPTAVAAASGLAVPTTHHLLSTLCAEGLVARTAQRRYVLGPGIAVLAEAYARADVVPSWLMRPLRTLALSCGETAYVSAWRGEEIHVLASVEGGRAVRVASAERGPYRCPHARATGKLLLAFAPPERRRSVLGDRLEAVTARTIVDRGELEAELAAIRSRGWSDDVEEFLDGVACVAAPALLEETVVATYTIAVPAHDIDRRRPDLLAAVHAAAATAVRTHQEQTEAP